MRSHNWHSRKTLLICARFAKRWMTLRNSFFCRFLYLNIFFICIKKWLQNIKFKVSAFILKIKFQATFVQTALNSWAVIGWKMFKFPVQVFWTWSINIYLLELALDMRQLHRYLLLKALMYYLSIVYQQYFLSVSKGLWFRHVK